ARGMQWDERNKCVGMKSTNSTHSTLSMNHKKLPVAVDLAVTTCEVGHEPHQIKPPDATELGELNAIVEAFDIGNAIVKILQPLLQRFGVVHAIEIPAFYRSEILVIGRNRIKAPITAVRENVFVGVNAGHVIGSANRDDVKEELPTGLQEGGKFSERRGDVPHMTKNPHRNDLVEFFIELGFVEISFDKGKST